MIRKLWVVRLVLFNNEMQDINFAKRGEYSLHIRKFFLFPPFWADTNKDIGVTSREWKYVKFDKVNRNRVSTKKGLYAFVLKPSYPSFVKTHYLFYLGKTTRTLQDRFDEYFVERDGKGKYRYLVRDMLRLYDGHLYFYFLELDKTDDEISEFEEKLLNTFVPFVNTDIPEAKINPDLKYIYKAN